MSVAVLGAGGVIGGAIAARLERDGHRVRRLARAQCDLADPAACAAIDIAGADALVNAAGITEESASLPGAWNQAVAGWEAVLRRAAAAGVKRAVYVSSAHVYGPLEGDIDETSPPDPRSDYALLHFAAEQTLRRTGLPATVLRAGNVYGLPADPTRFARWALIPYAFPLAAVRVHRILLATPGLQMRNFVAAEALAAATAEALAGPPAFDVLNVAGRDTLRVRDFADRVAAAAKRTLGLDVAVERPAAPPGAPAGAPAAAPPPLRFRARGGERAGDLDAFLAAMLNACAALKEP